MAAEYPENDTPLVPATPAAASESSIRRAPARTRFVEVPQTPERAAGPRNLAWGVVFILLAFAAYWFALILENNRPPTHAATRTIIATLGTFGILWLLFNVRILRQRHGLFFAAGLVTLFGAVLPLAEYGFVRLDSLARARVADEQPVLAPAPAAQPAIAAATPPPVPTAATAKDSAPADIPLEPGGTAEPVDDGSLRELIPAPLDETAGRVVEMKEDTTVTVQGRQHRVKKGAQFPLISLADGVVTFKAGDHTASVALELATFKGPSRETPAQIKALAQKEATRLYPDLGVLGSEQNEIYLEATKDLMVTLPEYFKDPKWPLHLAKKMAAMHGWKSTEELAAGADAPETDGPPAPPSEAKPAPPTETQEFSDPLPVKPAQPAPTAPPPSDIPQEAPPPPAN